MKHIRWLIRNLEELGSYVLLLVIVFTVSLAIFSRVLNQSIVWTDELSRYSFIWLVYLGSVVAWKRKSHIALDFFVGLFPAVIQSVIRFIMHTGLIILFAVIFYYSVNLTIETWGVPTTSLELPTGLVYLAVPVSMGLMILYTLIDMFHNFRKDNQFFDSNAISVEREG